MLQAGRYRAGFDADENEPFSETSVDGADYWFQLSLAAGHRLAAGERVELDVSPAPV